MANRFNQFTSGGEGDATNGSLDIWGYSLRASNLDNNKAMKTNAIGQLISSNLNISDVNNLQSELDATIQNPNNSVLVTDGLTITTGNILKTDEIHESTLGTNINLANDLYTNNIIVTGANELKTNSISEASVAAGVTIQNELKVDSIDSKGGAISVSFPSNLNSADIICDNLREKTLLAGVTCQNNLHMNSKVIDDVNEIKVDSIDSKAGAISVSFPSNLNSADIICDNLREKTLLGGVTCQNELKMNSQTISDVNEIKVDSIDSKGGVISVSFPSNLNSADIICDNLREKTLLGGVNCQNNLNMNNNNILNNGNIQTASINNVVQVRSASDLPTPALGFHKLVANTQYVIIGSVTLTNGFDFSNGGCSVTGVDMGTSTVIFDESANDIVGFYGRDANIYVSDLTISGGGGHFADSVDGLFDCNDYDLLAPAPFYGRNRRFRVQSCNILSAYRLGRVVGFGTLNCNNNFINGGGGAPSGVYTVEGFRFTGGLSLEFIGNKVVLFAGAQIANSNALLKLENNVSPVLSFNAVVISSNIIHPRSTETGISFDAGSTTQLGTISGNTFIRTGGSAPLIDYTDVSLYNNYNPLSIENYSISGNAGVVDSEPNLKSAIGNSNGSTAVNPTRDEVTPTFNDQVLKIDSSARFAVQVDMTGGTQAFVANERMSDAQLGTNFLILAVDAAAGVSPNITQTVYVTDMSGTPQQIPNPVGGWTSPSGGAFTTATFKYRYRYSEKDPRKLVTTATFNIATGNNEQYFIAPGNGVVDANCEVSGIANASGVGGTVSLSCTRVFTQGDIINFFISSAGGSSTSVTKGIINIK